MRHLKLVFRNYSSNQASVKRKENLSSEKKAQQQKKKDLSMKPVGFQDQGFRHD